MSKSLSERAALVKEAAHRLQKQAVGPRATAGGVGGALLGGLAGEGVSRLTGNKDLLKRLLLIGGGAGAAGGTGAVIGHHFDEKAKGGGPSQDDIEAELTDPAGPIGFNPVSNTTPPPGLSDIDPASEQIPGTISDEDLRPPTPRGQRMSPQDIQSILGKTQGAPSQSTMTAADW
jgi:hypothetical protein